MEDVELARCPAHYYQPCPCHSNSSMIRCPRGCRIPHCPCPPEFSQSYRPSTPRTRSSIRTSIREKMDLTGAHAPSAAFTLPPLPQLFASTRASRICSWAPTTVQLHCPGPGRPGILDQRTGGQRLICLRKWRLLGQDVLPPGSPSESLHSVTLLLLARPPH